jgi:hypothetical protein
LPPEVAAFVIPVDTTGGIFSEITFGTALARGALEQETPMMKPSLEAAFALVAAVAACGCDGTTKRAPGPTSPPAKLSDVTLLLMGRGVDQIDLLLVIDNSRSMADKQQALASAVPDLVRGLANPPCVGAMGTFAAQPNGPFDPCPEGTRRRMTPIRDMHIGVITSSIGGHGSDACPSAETESCPGGATNTSNDDAGHLVTRADPCGKGATATYQGSGFLAWDPAGKLTPPGEPSLGAIGVDPGTGAVSTIASGLVASLKDLVLGAGQVGCGYESSMESWYRFLVDPEPYESIVIENDRATPKGIDHALLQQRADFLRPGSLLLVVGLSDENDCSIKEYGQFYYAAQQRDPKNPNKNFYLPRARSECAEDPNDPCCLSCGQSAPPSCPPDPSCGSSLDAKTDDVNLRCWDQKRRFGIDFLYPIERYTDALTMPVIPNRAGELVQNPIFAPGSATGPSVVRDPSLVFVSYLVGVPWQDLARNPGNIGEGLKRGQELSIPDGSGLATWDVILGKPALQLPPLDPLMIESTAPRSGDNPITGDPIAPPSSAPGPGPNPMNGHEYTSNTKDGVQQWPDDLQYACVFPIPAPRDCSDPDALACECRDPQNDNPLCEPDPQKGGDRTLQVRAKAYPGLRQLSLLQSLGDRGIPSSICPAQTSDPTSADYGYRPAVGVIVDAISERLPSGGSLMGHCLPRRLDVSLDGRVSCTILEARDAGVGLDVAACDAFCAKEPGRAPVPARLTALAAVVRTSSGAKAASADCVCEIPEAQGAPSPGCKAAGSELAACQCDAADVPFLNGAPLGGWCYVDGSVSPPIGDPSLIASCPAGQQRMLRFAGDARPVDGALVAIACEDP